MQSKSTTLDCVSFKYLSAVTGFPTTPGWDSPAYVSSLAHALMHDNDCGPRIPEYCEFMIEIRRMIEQNQSIQEIPILKKVCSFLIAKIPNGWNPLVSKRLRVFGVESDLINNSFDFL